MKLPKIETPKILFLITNIVLFLILVTACGKSGGGPTATGGMIPYAKNCNFIPIAGLFLGSLKQVERMTINDHCSKGDHCFDYIGKIAEQHQIALSRDATLDLYEQLLKEHKPPPPQSEKSTPP